MDCVGGAVAPERSAGAYRSRRRGGRLVNPDFTIRKWISHLLAGQHRLCKTQLPWNDNYYDKKGVQSSRQKVRVYECAFLGAEVGDPVIPSVLASSQSNWLWILILFKYSYAFSFARQFCFSFVCQTKLLEKNKWFKAEQKNAGDHWVFGTALKLCQKLWSLFYEV